MKIRGRVVYMDLATGFWGIVDEAGNRWRPVVMPEGLRRQGREVELDAEPVAEDASVFMWGTPIRILDEP